MFNHLQVPLSEKTVFAYSKLQNHESFLFQFKIILNQLSYIFIAYLLIRLISSFVCLY